MNIGKKKIEEVVFLSFLCKSMKQMVGNCKEIGFLNLSCVISHSSGLS